MTATTTCQGCAHTETRLKYSARRAYCKLYHQFRAERCIDYRTKTSAIKAALNFFKSAASK